MTLQTACVRAAMVVVGLTGAVACSKTPPKTPAAAPTELNVPAPPPRHVVPVSLQPTDPPPPAADPQPATPAKPPSPPPSTSKPDRTPPPQPPPPPANTDTPPPVLQTTRNFRELESKARTDLGRAKAILAKIVVTRLPPDAKATYNEAQAWITQAEEALGLNNFIAAEQFASKAVTFAEALAKVIA